MENAPSESQQREIKRITERILEKFDKEFYDGVLLCEGSENSIDIKLYSKVYLDLLVIPAGGCTDIIKMIGSIRRKCKDVKIYGLIDRDGNSKREIKAIKKEYDVYCTKLPFIENIICSPEIIRLICNYLGFDYETIMQDINETLLKQLVNKLKIVLPINVSLNPDEVFDFVSISIKPKEGRISEKIVTNENILYSFRDKSIVSVVADKLFINGRSAYYEFIAELLDNEDISDELINIVSTFLPLIKISNKK